jgi:hypothetical protein
MTLNSGCKVCVFGFHAAQFSRSATSSLGRARSRRSLSTQAFAFAFCCSTRFGEERRGCSYRVSRGHAGRLSFCGIDNRGRATPFDLDTFQFNSRCIIGNYAQVAISTFYFMG